MRHFLAPHRSPFAPPAQHAYPRGPPGGAPPPRGSSAAPPPRRGPGRPPIDKAVVEGTLHELIGADTSLPWHH